MTNDLDFRLLRRPTMSETYEEILQGETVLRRPPGHRHELVCSRLHAAVTASLASNGHARLLPPRSIVQLSAGTLVRPDLAMVTAANNRLWLVAEVITPDDHRLDTVAKKMIYEDLNPPRLWMVDIRYDNVEVYHSSPYGLTLQRILAHRESLTDSLLPALQVTMSELFRD